MKSLASTVAALLLASTAAQAQEPPPGEGPRGTSQVKPGEARYDAVGRSGVAEGGGVVAVTAMLPAGSVAEVTALDSGRTILVSVARGEPAPGTIVALSAAAMSALHLKDGDAVRLRAAVASPPEQAALRSGGEPPVRADAPAALLAALRRQLPVAPVAVASARALRRPAPAKPREALMPRPTPTPTPTTAAVVAKPAAVVHNGYVVQVATFSTEARATAAARAIGGTVVGAKSLWRVRFGPYADTTAAARAKADAAKRGYPGAQIIRYP